MKLRTSRETPTQRRSHLVITISHSNRRPSFPLYMLSRSLIYCFKVHSCWCQGWIQETPALLEQPGVSLFQDNARFTVVSVAAPRFTDARFTDESASAALVEMFAF